MKPWEDSLSAMMHAEGFRQVVDDKLFFRIDSIRKLGNRAAHTHKEVKKEAVVLCLRHLFVYLSFLAHCYSSKCRDAKFDVKLLETVEEIPVPTEDPPLKELWHENLPLKLELTQQRKERQASYNTPPEDLTEAATRKVYIDAMLEEAGWVEGKNWRNEVELIGMPNESGVGYADYVLYGNDGKALAVVEAKKFSKGVEAGRQQAKLYADLIEKKQGRRPVIFLTNGIDTRIIDTRYPERRVSAIYSKRDLEKLYNLEYSRLSLQGVQVDKSITDRYYQEAAIKATCEALAANKRKALLAMATGSGKTRTIIALCRILLERGWVKNLLFLADRTALVTQAMRAFAAHLSSLSLTSLCSNQPDYNACAVFSTYNSMMNCIDDAKDAEGRIFSCGHFDLVICDEAHRSIYNRYKDIFAYFDAPLVGLTATPKDEVDRNTYEIFDLQNGIPTYGYDFKQAVADDYLVDYKLIETALRFLSEGINPEELSAEEREDYVSTFEDEDGEVPESIDPAALNKWVFNKDTIRKVLADLMRSGIRVDYGNKIGKSIIFAKNHAHAEKILEVFNEEYPHLAGQALVIDNQMSYAQAAIDDFSNPMKNPQVAISVDMLDTGIDVPEVVNLVFFKPVYSRAKFWQMIGRGTRKCPGLFGTEDKSCFYIFDYCACFEYFRMSKGKETPNALPIQGALFCLKARIASKLQALEYQTAELKVFRARLVEEMLGKVQALNRRNFSVVLHLRYVERYSQAAAYENITYEDTVNMREELAFLIEPEKDEADALRFDGLMYGVELAYLAAENKKVTQYKNEILRKAKAVSQLSNIHQVAEKSDLLNRILHGGYLDHAGVNEFEHIRRELRDLMVFIPRTARRYDIDYKDAVLSVEVDKPMPDDGALESYRAKAEYYVRQHKDSGVIGKLRRNIPLSDDDVRELERILWSEVGTKDAYDQECEGMPLGEFVRRVVGLDMGAAKAAFSDFLDSADLDSRQIYFVNQIVEYIVRNGVMKKFEVLREAPFTNLGGLKDLFGSNIQLWEQIRQTIQRINTNAGVA